MLRLTLLQVAVGTLRDLRSVTSDWYTAVLSYVLIPGVTVGCLGVGLGTLTVEISGPGIGSNYLSDVVAPGVVLSTALTGAIFVATYPAYAAMRVSRRFSATVTAPVRPGTIFASQLITMCAHAVAIGAATCMAFVLVAGIATSAVLALLMTCVAVTCSVCPLLFALSVSIKTTAVLAVLYRLIITPLLLFSGIFFPLAALPRWAEVATWLLSPLWNGVHVYTSFLNGDWSGLATSATYLLFTAVAGCRLATIIFTRELST